MFVLQYELSTIKKTIHRTYMYCDNLSMLNGNHYVLLFKFRNNVKGHFFCTKPTESGIGQGSAPARDAGHGSDATSHLNGPLGPIETHGSLGR